jgi:murein DD-endopeptidase MepM/ murein hydrolase activator NlpD
MKYLIKESKLEKHIQALIDASIRSLIEQSEEWGLGEMHELEVLNSLNHIEIDRIVSVKKIKVYINMYLNYYYDDMDDLRSEIQYKLEEWMPNIELYINQIYDVNGDPIVIEENKKIENKFKLINEQDPYLKIVNTRVQPKYDKRYIEKEIDNIRKFNKQKIIEPVAFPSNFVSNFAEDRTYEIHPGIDIATPSGTPVKTPLDGIVELVSPNLNKYCGGTIDIKHPSGYWTRFCHVKQINVKNGQKLKQGDIVGLSGGGKNDIGKGKSSGPHLHWTLKLNDVKVDASKHIGKEI